MKIKFLLIFLLFPHTLYAACGGSSPTWTAASASYADVSECVSGASSGDTINIPTGTATWASTLIIGNIKLIGNGVANTIITINVTSATLRNERGILIEDGSNGTRISGIRFNNAGSTEYAIILSNAQKESSTGVKNFRIDNCYFSGFGHAVETNGYSYGVIDNNSFIGQTGSSIWIYGDDSTAWTRDTNLGGSDWVFIEDNVFETGNTSTSHFILANWGGKMVVRHNTFEETGTGTRGGWIDAHGFGHGANVRGTRAWEIYENTLTRSGTATCCRGLYLRGGTGVAYNNTFDETNAAFLHGALHKVVDLVEYRASLVSGISTTTSTDCSNGSGWCRSAAEDAQRYCIDSDYSSDGDACSVDTDCEAGDGVCSPYGEGYNCCDQVGTGKDQVVEPAYFWGNVTDNDDEATTKTFIIVDSGSANYIVEEQDYYLTTHPTYTAYTYPHPLQGDVVSAPVRSAGSPSSNVSYTATVTLALTTDVNATCKYGTVASTAYASIANTFGTTGTTSHSQGSVAVSEGSNTFYVRCINADLDPNLDDYIITFNVLSASNAHMQLGGSGSVTIGGSGTITIQ